MAEDVIARLCTYTGCEKTWMIECHHGMWCEDHVLAHQEEDDYCRKAFAEAMLRLQFEYYAKLLRLRDELLPVRFLGLEMVAPFAEQYHESFVTGSRAHYEAEGEPYGPGDEAMWRWYAEHVNELTQ